MKQHMIAAILLAAGGTALAATRENSGLAGWFDILHQGLPPQQNAVASPPPPLKQDECDTPLREMFCR